MKIIRNDLNTNTFLTAEHGRLSGEDIYIFKTGGVEMNLSKATIGQ